VRQPAEDDGGEEHRDRRDRWAKPFDADPAAGDVWKAHGVGSKSGTLAGGEVM
jgi:hypothetical protein